MLEDTAIICRIFYYIIGVLAVWVYSSCTYCYFDPLVNVYLIISVTLDSDKDSGISVNFCMISMV